VATKRHKNNLLAAGKYGVGVVLLSLLPPVKCRSADLSAKALAAAGALYFLC
jgi:hypothetical protein